MRDKTYTNPVICSYCKKHMYDKRGFTTKAISHGICPDCYAKIMKQYEKRVKTESSLTFEEFMLEKLQENDS